MTCTCCGCELETDTEHRLERCVYCALGLCRCQLTQEEEAAADRLVDDMATAAGLGGDESTLDNPETLE